MFYVSYMRNSRLIVFKALSLSLKHEILKYFVNEKSRRKRPELYNMEINLRHRNTLFHMQ